MARIRFAVLTVLAVTGLTAAGCGSSTQNNTSTRSATAPTPIPVSVPGLSVPAKKTRPLTRAQLTAKADAICGRIKARRELLKFGTSGSLVVILPQLTAYEQALFTELGDLSPPAAMTSSWDQVVAYAQTMAESTAQLNRDAQTNTSKGGRQLFAVFAQARRQFEITAMHSGLPVCARY